MTLVSMSSLNHMITYIEHWFNRRQDIIWGHPDIVDEFRSGNQHHPSPKIGDFE